MQLSSVVSSIELELTLFFPFPRRLTSEGDDSLHDSALTRVSASKRESERARTREQVRKLLLLCGEKQKLYLDFSLSRLFYP